MISIICTTVLVCKGRIHPDYLAVGLFFGLLEFVLVGLLTIGIVSAI